MTCVKIPEMFYLKILSVLDRNFSFAFLRSHFKVNQVFKIPMSHCSKLSLLSHYTGIIGTSSMMCNAECIYSFKLFKHIIYFCTKVLELLTTAYATFNTFIRFVINYLALILIILGFTLCLNSLIRHKKS